MTMGIEARRIAKASAPRGGAVARRTERDGAAVERSVRPEETPGVRYLYDEDGRILAEAFVGPEGD